MRAFSIVLTRALSAVTGIALGLAFIDGAAAQQLPPPLNPNAASNVQAAMDSNSIMGFETPAGWSVKGNQATTPQESATATRTQGLFALAIQTPSNLTKLTSLPVASTAAALAGIGASGASFHVDVMLPVQQGNPNNAGQLQLLVDSSSLGLSKVPVGTVNFSGLRLGIYTTMKIPIPDAIRTALAGAPFTDLTFEFMISSPGHGAGTYLFDNLRVHSVTLVTAIAGTTPPPGYGGSADFVVFGGTPQMQTFDAGPVQVPDSFHLKLGAAGSTVVQLDLGYDGTPSVTCTYTGDTSDTNGKTYKPLLCTGGVQPGDIVGANWARLSITGGDSSMKLRAQLARSPIGDLLGAGIIPPMPTYWGDFDSCVPATVADQVHPPVASPPSVSCAAQAAEASQIVTAYVNKVNSGPFTGDWIVTPVPESARRHGDASPQDYIAGVPPPPGDPDFDQGGHINEGGNFDAYWRMHGNFVTGNETAHTTNFDMTLGAHAVLFGQDVNVLTIEATEESNSGQVGGAPPSADATLSVYVFGIQAPGADIQPAVSFDKPLEASDDFTIEAQIWVFDLKFSASGRAGVDINGSLSLAGAQINFIPEATVGLHAFGGIGITGLVSGGVDVTIPRLLDVRVIVGALLNWFPETDPDHCGATLSFQASGTASVLSDGGDISLTATFGDCPFCIDYSHSIFSWGPLLEGPPKTLFEYDTSTTLFKLPTSLCTAPLSVAIDSPTPGTTSLQAKTPFGLSGTAVSTNGGSPVQCATDFTWTLSPGGVFQGTNNTTYTGCNPAAVFANAGPATIGLTATHVYNSPSGPITETKSASSSIVIAPLPDGDYIQSLAEPSKLDILCLKTPCTNNVLTVFAPAPGVTYNVNGFINGASEPVCTAWTATDPFGNTTSLPDDTLFDIFPFSQAHWTPSSSVPSGIYTITMTTANGACGSGGTTFGSAQLTVIFETVK